MVRNGAISIVRRESRRRVADTIASEPTTQSAETVAVANLRACEIAAEVAHLAPQQGAVVALRLGGMSVAETAAAMNVAVGTVKTHRHRAAQIMRISLADDRQRDVCTV